MNDTNQTQPPVAAPTGSDLWNPETPDAYWVQGTEARVCDDIAQRQRRGISKYGTSVEGNPLPLKAWLQHAYEEHLDAAIYLRRALEQLEREDPDLALKAARAELDRMRSVLNEAGGLLIRHHDVSLCTWQGQCPVCSRNGRETYPENIFGRLERCIQPPNTERSGGEERR